MTIIWDSFIPTFIQFLNLSTTCSLASSLLPATNKDYPYPYLTEKLNVVPYFPSCLPMLICMHIVLEAMYRNVLTS